MSPISQNLQTATHEPSTVDVEDLRLRVQDTYRAVAEDPDGEFHFEMGRPLAERLGYPAGLLDRIPGPAVDSFAGVGYHLDLAGLKDGDAVADLGSGSGMDAFAAALQLGARGRVVGVDMTEAQRNKARRLAERGGFDRVQFEAGFIEELPLRDDSFDAVISNGVINLSHDKPAVFREAYRVLRPGGRLAISDIVTKVQLPPTIVCNASLWAACIGGAMERAAYLRTIEEAGFTLHLVRLNPEYAFISDRADGAARKYGVGSISVLAFK
jgi:arsenite methyltransferase